MEIKVRQFNDVIGMQKNIKILRLLFDENSIPEIMWFKGSSGTGKSTVAEILAMSLTCEKGEFEPCMQCQSCRINEESLNSQQQFSRNIKKINLGEISSKKDALELIQKVFDLDPIPDKRIVYILEELQELKNFQGMFLERLRDLPEGVHIIGTTTNLYTLSEAFQTRAQITLTFNTLNFNACMLLVNKIVEKEGLKITDKDKKILITESRNNARVITHCLKTFSKIPNIGSVLRTYFSTIDPMVYIEIIQSMFKDFASFIIDLDTMSANTDLIEFHKGLKPFMQNAIFNVFANRATTFTKPEREEISKLFINLSVHQIRGLLRLSNHNARTVQDVEALLIEMQEVVSPVVLTKSNIQEELFEENKTSSINYQKLKKEGLAKPNPEIAILSLEDVFGTTGNLEGFKGENLWLDE